MPQETELADLEQQNGAKVSSATISTVVRAVDVLMYFKDAPTRDLGVSEIAEGLGMSKAAVHRMLASLRVRGLIELDETTRRYSLGIGIMQLGLAYMERIDIRRMAHPELVRLSNRTMRRRRCPCAWTSVPVFMWTRCCPAARSSCR